MTQDAEALRRAIEAAASARAGLARSVGDVAGALAEAAKWWRRAPDLPPRLAAGGGWAPVMVADALDGIVAPFDAPAMERLAAQERPTTAPPAVVAHVLASNVPALALPAIAHALLAGAAVVVKSGRGDVVSAPTFHDALRAVDPDLARTVVTASWPRGDTARDAALLAAAPVTVLTGSDEAIAALAPRAHGRVLTFGARTSVAILADPSSADVDAFAADVACWEQHGCLSPQVAFVLGDAACVADALAGSLERLAARWPLPARAVETRAARRVVLDDAAWTGASVRAGDWGAVVLAPPGPAAVGPGGRTIRVQPLDDLRALPERLSRGKIESVGTNGPLPDGLAAFGVSRVCRVGAMQRPSLGWPRGGRPPIRMLFEPHATAAMEDDR